MAKTTTKKKPKQAAKSARKSRAIQTDLSDQLMLPEAVAALLQCHVRTVHRLIKAGKLGAVTLGREYRIPKKAYNAYLETELYRPDES
jgi:excisionase family DNA binding protein